MSLVNAFLDSLDQISAWVRLAVGATVESMCELETADSPSVLVGNDGSLVSVIQVSGVQMLVGNNEFSELAAVYERCFSSLLSNDGHSLQVVFSFSREKGQALINKNYADARETIGRLKLDLNDLMREKEERLPLFCADEKVFLVIWTRPDSLTNEQRKRAFKEQSANIAASKFNVASGNSQNILAALPALRESHDSNIRTFMETCGAAGVEMTLLNVHEALYLIRSEVDWSFTDDNWQPMLPGDKIRPSVNRSFRGDVSDLLWPPIYQQIFPRDAFNIDLNTCQIGDLYYGMVYIDLYPREIKLFNELLRRCLNAKIPWRIAFNCESGGMASLSLKKAFATVLSFSSVQNRLIADSIDLLSYIDINTDDAIVKLRTVCTTWATTVKELKVRISLLSRAVQGWGSCDVSEVSGDAFRGLAGTLPAVTKSNYALPTVAPCRDIVRMLPLYRPSSPWTTGVLMFRSPDGKPWPYQPGSTLQSTSIDLIYARPGSGKSVLANAINLAICLSPAIKKLPRISIIDIGPSSSGLISLLKEALPINDRHLAEYHRLTMSEDHSINPFDTQLGARKPTPPERAFLVNFLTLLVTPMGDEKPYDGMSDMIGMVIDEAYKSLGDKANPNLYTVAMNTEIDATLQDIGFVLESKTSWWEVTDALFSAGFYKMAHRAQRFAVPLLSDLVSVSRNSNVEDLYGKIKTPTGEMLITTFTRMISSAAREYPILSRPTRFDIGEARIVSLDLDEVAKSGGEAANKQTAVMYMLARYVLTKNFYLNIDGFSDLQPAYLAYHDRRIKEDKEEPKRLVMDEFHRTSHSSAVRSQVVQDMREGRKWGVQVALISQALDDFDSVMIDFATSTFIMDAGPEQAIQKSVKTFGLPKSAESALRNYVRGPSQSGATMLGIFATKNGTTTQLITLTLGPVELWAFSTTAEDYYLRTILYQRIGPQESRRVLARVFPSGTATSYLAKKVKVIREQSTDESAEEVNTTGLVNELAEIIIRKYNLDSNFTVLD